MLARRIPFTISFRGTNKPGGASSPEQTISSQVASSDDTQLTISVARSLNPDGTVDNDYFAKQELRHSIDYARGAGATVTAAARAAARQSANWRWNFFRFKRGRHGDLDYRGAGANGAAMRIAPIALANLDDQRRSMVETWKNAIVTHGHARAIMGAVVYAEILRSAIHNALDDEPKPASIFVEAVCSFIESLVSLPTMIRIFDSGCRIGTRTERFFSTMACN